MSNEYTVIGMDDGTHTVIRKDPANPRVLEVIVNFYDVARATDYANSQSKPEATITVTPVTNGTLAVGQTISDASGRFEGYKIIAREPAELNELTVGQKSVLLALCDASDEDGLASLSAKEIAEAAKLPHGSIVQYLEALQNKGRIELEKQGGGRKSNVYRILVPASDVKAAA